MACERVKPTYMCASCFGLFLGHPQACKYKNLTNEDIIKIATGPLFTVTNFYNVKTPKKKIRI